MNLNLIISKDEKIQEQFKEIALTPVPACHCGNCPKNECDEELTEELTFECAGCKREVFWCYGASDRFEEYCDQCWTVLNAAFPDDNDN